MHTCTHGVAMERAGGVVLEDMITKTDPEPD